MIKEGRKAGCLSHDAFVLCAWAQTGGRVNEGVIEMRRADMACIIQLGLVS